MDLRDEVAKAAYYLFEKYGRVHGRHEEHWYEAEQRVMSAMEKSAKKGAPITLAGSKNLVRHNPQKRGIWPQDKPAAEGKKSTRARRAKGRSGARP